MTTAPSLPNSRGAIPPHAAALPAEAPSPVIVLTAGNLRAWGGKSAYSLIDQGLTSLTGFFVTFLLARWMSADLFGAYSVAFAAYLFINGFHNVILLEPMSVFGPARHAARLQSYFRAQMKVHIVLATILCVAAALVDAIVWRVTPQNPLVGAILGSAVALPFLLCLWLARRMCYVLQRPRIAILGSGACLAFVLLGLYALRHLDWLSPFFAFLLIGAGSLLGSALILQQLHGTSAQPAESAHSTSLPPPPQIPWRNVLRENWTYGRWLVGTAVLYPISGQVQMFLVAALLGLGSAGILRAMMLPAALMTQVVSATDLLILPGFSYDFGRGSLSRMFQKALLVSCALGAAGLGVAALLWLIAAPLEHMFFRGKFAAFAWLMPVLALVPAVNGFNSGFSAVLRGSQKPHFDLLANAVAAPLALISAFAFIHWWGLAGAAISLVAGSAVLALVNFCSYLYFVRCRSRRDTPPDEPAFSPGKAS